MAADHLLGDEAVGEVEDVFDGVFECGDVAEAAHGVGFDEGGHGGGFAAAGGAADEDEAGADVDEFFEVAGEVDVFDVGDVACEEAEGEALAEVVVGDVCADAPCAFFLCEGVDVLCGCGGGGACGGGFFPVEGEVGLGAVAAGVDVGLVVAFGVAFEAGVEDVSDDFAACFESLEVAEEALVGVHPAFADVEEGWAVGEEVDV